MQTTDKILHPMKVVHHRPPGSSPTPDPDNLDLQDENEAEVKDTEYVSEESRDWQMEEESETDENIPPDALKAAKIQAKKKLKKKVSLVGVYYKMITALFK